MRSLDANQKVHTIVLDIRSPGGTVMGTPEAADAVRAVRDGGNTRIVSVANGMMASAATWIGTAAEKVYVTPSGEAGSIGVISVYEDWSKAYEAAGIKLDVMRVPDRKARFTGVEPLTDEMRNLVMQRISESYDSFRAAMAKNRGIRVDQVEKRFGGGEMLSAQEAVDAGLVDGIATLDEVLIKAVKGTKRTAPSSARAQLAKAELEAIE
jgi:signal peptide peptidase SppA